MSRDVSPQRMVVAPGCTVYRGPGAHGFRAGDVVDLPAEHAAELAGAGHVHPESHAAPAPAPASDHTAR